MFGTPRPRKGRRLFRCPNSPHIPARALGLPAPHYCSAYRIGACACFITQALEPKSSKCAQKAMLRSYQASAIVWGWSSRLLRGSPPVTLIIPQRSQTLEVRADTQHAKPRHSLCKPGIVTHQRHVAVKGAGEPLPPGMHCHCQTWQCWKAEGEAISVLAQRDQKNRNAIIVSYCDYLLRCGHQYVTFPHTINCGIRGNKAGESWLQGWGPY